MFTTYRKLLSDLAFRIHSKVLIVCQTSPSRSESSQQNLLERLSIRNKEKIYYFPFNNHFCLVFIKKIDPP